MLDSKLNFPTADHTLSIIDTPERPYLCWLQLGIKTAEGRVNSPKYHKINIGDKHEYSSFQAMLEVEGVACMLPFLKPTDLQQGIAVYNNFPGSGRVEIFGCVALGISIEKFQLNS